jgi:nitroimidazol reductase NimA-like FMN-containing flavoprotein (pyridoxamine 5'-phosphate oxidase superfamily)
MNLQELKNELEQPGAQELLKSDTLARLAYTGLDGKPRVIPVGFLWTGERIVVCTAVTAPKVRALACHPEVALTIDLGATPSGAKALLIRGSSELETVDGVADEYLAMAEKSMQPPQRKEFEQAVRAMYKQMVRISIEPSWARFYDFGAGRFPAFLAELARDASK